MQLTSALFAAITFSFIPPTGSTWRGGEGRGGEGRGGEGRGGEGE